MASELAQASGALQRLRSASKLARYEIYLPLDVGEPTDTQSIVKNHSPQIHASAPTRVACALLAGWIFILSLAGVSPALHSWLHADSSCTHSCETHSEDSTPAGNNSDGHYCGVIALQDGLAPIIAAELPERASYERIHFESQNQRLLSHTSELRLQARAPPVEI